VTSTTKEEKEKDKKGKGKKGKDDKAPEELSEEDTALKEGLELAVARLQEEETGVHEQALQHLVTEIKSSTSSMTAVPKPLKFLRPHYASLRAVYDRWPSDYALKTDLADVLSVLSMTMAEPGSRQCLKYRLVGSRVDISSWGHVYVRALAGEISEEYNTRSLEVPSENEVDVDDLIELVNVIIPYQMSHNAEAEAVRNSWESDLAVSDKCLLFDRWIC
jgi:26S proteasome regulatory subunit N1